MKYVTYMCLFLIAILSRMNLGLEINLTTKPRFFSKESIDHIPKQFSAMSIAH